MNIDLSGNPFFLSGERIRWVTETLANMTDEEKAGQLFCVMGGDYEPDELLEMVTGGMVGGVLFRPEPAEAIRARFEPLDRAAKLPLIKAANLEEGGAGAITDGTLFGWPMLTAAADDLSLAERFGEVCAYEGRSVGVNLSFSPVCDLDMNYRNPITNVRTFGRDPRKVARFAGAYMDALQQNGVAACAKHFPGDGVDFRDQHLHPTYNSLSAAQWRSSYGAVYRRLIDGGLKCVMCGHIVQPALEMEKNPALRPADCLPASQSPELMRGVLREELGFNGLITTDATIMGGYCMTMDRARAIPQSVMAGCDMLVFSTDIREDYRYLLDGLRSGLLTRERLDEAAARVLALKASVCFDAPTARPVDGAYWHGVCADKAVTLVKNNQPEVFPVTAERYPRIRLIFLGKDDIADGSVTDIARAYLEQVGFDVELYRPEEDELHGTSGLDPRRLTLYLANYEHASNQTTVRIDWCKKHALDTPRFLTEEPCVFVSFANPYHLQDVPRIRTYINAYTATRSVIERTLDKLMGKSGFTGVSPVDAFCGLPDTHY